MLPRIDGMKFSRAGHVALPVTSRAAETIGTCPSLFPSRPFLVCLFTDPKPRYWNPSDVQAPSVLIAREGCPQILQILFRPQTDPNRALTFFFRFLCLGLSSRDVLSPWKDLSSDQQLHTINNKSDVNRDINGKCRHF